MSELVKRYSLTIVYGHPDGILTEDLKGTKDPKHMRRCEYIIHTDDVKYLDKVVQMMVMNMTQGMGPYPAKLEGWAILDHELKYD